MEFLLFQIVILIFSVVVHEVSHGFMAYSLGDTTAKNAGRLTLNPIPHIDLFGSIILPGTLLLLSYVAGAPGPIIGWAKPVPINPFNLRDQKFGPMKVSLAGPGANFAIALVFGLALRFFPLETINPMFALAASYIVYLNILLGVFNLVPIPPLDGSYFLFAFLPRSLEAVKMFLVRYGLFLLLFLLFFFPELLVFITNAIFQAIVGMPLR